MKNDQKYPFITESADLAGEGTQRRKPLENRFNLALSFLSHLLFSPFLIFTIYFSPTVASAWVILSSRGSFWVGDKVP